MSEIFVLTSGNGYAYVDNAYPFEGDTVTLYAYPDTGETLDDVYAYESHGYSVALAVTQEQSFTYHESWGDLTIYVFFSGGGEPEPPIWRWFIPVINKMKRRRRGS